MAASAAEIRALAAAIVVGEPRPAARAVASPHGHEHAVAALAQRVLAADEVDPAAVPYFSLTMVPGERMRRADHAGRAVGEQHRI